MTEDKEALLLLTDGYCDVHDGIPWEECRFKNTHSMGNVIGSLSGYALSERLYQSKYIYIKVVHAKTGRPGYDRSKK